jgi:hypothetical protein
MSASNGKHKRLLVGRGKLSATALTPGDTRNLLEVYERNRKRE